MDISPRPEEKKQQKKGLRFSEGVVERATDKENVDSLANAFGAASFGGAKLVSPGTYLRKHPMRYDEPPLTPGTALREPKAPASRWTPSARDSGASLGDDDDDDDDDGEEDKEEGGDAASSVAASPVDDGKLCRESFGMFHRQQAAIDAAAASDDPPPAIKIIKSAPDQKTPAVPRYVKSYRETPDSAESRCSEWTPRGGDDDSDSDSEDDAGMALSP